MNSDRVDAMSTVSGTRATIPASIRHELDIDDGDRLRWGVSDDGDLRVEVVRQEQGTFAGFEGYDGDRSTEVVESHDTWGATDES